MSTQYIVNNSDRVNNHNVIIKTMSDTNFINDVLYNHTIEIRVYN